MKFSNKWYEDEVRLGFYIPSLMKRNWAAQMEVMEDVARVCKKLHIRWYLCDGNLLGAVRDGKYIPWDDDIDIRMMRSDFDRFVKEGMPLMPKNYCLRMPEETNNYSLTVGLMNSERGYLPRDPEMLEKYHGFPYNAHIDILVLDYLLQDEEEEDLRKRLVSSLYTALSNIIKREDKKKKEEQEKKEKEKEIEKEKKQGDEKELEAAYEELMNFTVGMAVEGNVVEAKSDEELEQLLDEIRLLYGDRVDHDIPIKSQLFTWLTELCAEGLSHFPAKNKFSTTDIALYTWYATDSPERYKLRDYRGDKKDAPAMMEFEGFPYPVPANYRRVLETIYGDYMTPVRGSAGHGYPCYHDYEEKICDILSVKWPFAYYFSKDDLEEKERIRQNPDRMAGELIQSLKNLHDVALSAVNAGDFGLAAETLAQCQSAAERLGEFLEQITENGMPETIQLLEEYCEDVYSSYVALTEAVPNDDAGAV